MDYQLADETLLFLSQDSQSSPHDVRSKFEVSYTSLILKLQV